MPSGRERKNDKIPQELKHIGDVSFILDAEFSVREVLRTDARFSFGERGKLPGMPIFNLAGISVAFAEMKSAIIEKGYWSARCTFSGHEGVLKLLSITGSKELYFAFFTLRPEPRADESLLPSLTASFFAKFPGFSWWGGTALKDGEASFTQGVGTLTGYSASEINMLPGKFLSLIHFEDAANIVRSVSKFLNEADEGKCNMEYRVICKDGNVRWLNETIVVGSENGFPRYAGFVFDVTDYKSAEEKGRQAELKLVETNLAKDRFINILSHDLRAPFTSILGFAEILLNESHLGQAERNEYLTYIYDASQNQLQFINYLLDWSRLKTGSLKIEPQRLRLQAIAYNCVSILTGNTIRKNLTINVEIPDTAYVQADERLVTQVVLNLLSNAIKFSHADGSIEMTAAAFNDTQMEIIVRDHGIGMSNEDQQKLFSIEKVISQEGTKGEKGSGFGLALVKEIVTRHEGEIWFYSEQGNGSEFHFTLPLPTNVVLLIAGDESDQTRISEALKNSFPNFKILTAESGFEGISLVEQVAPNLVIADNAMPLINGLQLVEAIKRGEAELKTPILIYGENLKTEEEGQYSRLGVRYVLQKPLDFAEFEHAVKTLLN